MQSIFRRPIVAMLAGVLTLSTIGLTPAQARHRYHHYGNAAVLGAVAGLFGTIAVLAARDRYRDEYDGCYGCYDEPYYYAPRTAYYAPSYGYGYGRRAYYGHIGGHFGGHFGGHTRHFCGSGHGGHAHHH